MALSFFVDTPEVVSLEEYVTYVQTQVDLRDLESISASAGMFRALMNNRKLLTGMLNRQLGDWETFQARNTYTPQTFVLATAPGFFIRANVWTPLSENAEVGAAEAQNFAYLIPHDHNFTFMTGGYLGSGYRTKIWQYDHKKLSGKQGEAVDLEFLEDTSLPSGKIMIYRKSLDVHCQEHADEFSISLNLMIVSEYGTNQANQVIFDTDSGTVKNVSNMTAGRISVCDLAQHVGDSETAALLDTLSHKHPDAQVRAAGMRSLVKMVPGEALPIFERAARDANTFVRQLAAHGLEMGAFPETLYQSGRIDPSPR